MKKIIALLVGISASFIFIFPLHAASAHSLKAKPEDIIVVQAAPVAIKTEVKKPAEMIGVVKGAPVNGVGVKSSKRGYDD